MLFRSYSAEYEFRGVFLGLYFSIHGSVIGLPHFQEVYRDVLPNGQSFVRRKHLGHRQELFIAGLAKYTGSDQLIGVRG